MDAEELFLSAVTVGEIQAGIEVMREQNVAKAFGRGGHRMTDWNTCPAVERNPGKISGAWVFTGTRVPVYALFENLESGATVQQFLEWFPDVEEWQVSAVLKHETEYFRTPA